MFLKITLDPMSVSKENREKFFNPLEIESRIDLYAEVSSVSHKIRATRVFLRECPLEHPDYWGPASKYSVVTIKQSGIFLHCEWEDTGNGEGNAEIPAAQVEFVDTIPLAVLSEAIAHPQ